MNWFIRFGQWWDNRKPLRKSDGFNLERDLNKILNRLDKVEQSKQFPTILVEVQKDLSVINNRLNKIELYIGLQRDPKPYHVEGSAKIS